MGNASHGKNLGMGNWNLQCLQKVFALEIKSNTKNEALPDKGVLQRRVASKK